MEGSGNPPTPPGHGTPGSGDPTHHMPPPSASEQPTTANPPPPAGGPPPPGYTIPQMNWPTGARLSFPGIAVWAMWFFVEIVFAIIWASSDEVGASQFVTISAVITFAYLISRGIAKASRVLEH